MTEYSKFVTRIGRDIERMQMVGAHDPCEYAEIAIDSLRRMAKRHRPYDAMVILGFLDFVEGK